MMNFKKLMSLFLAVLMLCGVMTSLSVMPAAADDVVDDEADSSVEETTSVDALYTEIYASPEEKLATMKLMTTKGNYSIYAKESSGEVAVKDLSTGQILFTNPYDIGAATASESVKNEILSQIIVKFDENGRERVYSSFEYAALRDQIKVKNIKNGIRVEYTIGREEARRLVPRMIRKDRFEEMIKAPMEEYYGVTLEDAEVFRYEKNHPLASASFYLCKQMSYFVYKSLDECTSDRLKQDLLDAFPIVKKMDIYILDKAATTTEIEKIEEVIKTACPNYSYEEMDYDHQLTEYTGDEENPPVFKMALEYTLGEDGFTVRLPANGIRFNESKFQLTNVSVLPYMGAGNNNYSGYTFYPDGSGALFAFEDLADQNTYTVASKIYGVDYAYHQISGTYQQTVRYPVFGIVENTEYYDCLYMNEETGEDETVRISSMIYDGVMKAQEDGLTSSSLYTKYGAIISGSEAEKVTVNRGYVAIIEEGDALTELVTYHAGVLSPYDTVQMNFNPRPKDSYNIADAISVGTNSEWTVVSNRKYVGNYKIHYVMLSDEDTAEKNQLPADGWYEASWLGMAKAYRDYLVDKGVLTQLSAEKTAQDIPLYIESFGAVETIEKFMSIPVEVMKPLTSTEDVLTMYDELSKAGATNINFKLTGFANGGVYYSTMPYKLKWEKAVSEEYSMQDLFDEAAKTEGGLSLFPEFEFSYQVISGMFDGFSSRKHAVRTIDDRFTFERPYMATQQKYSSSFRLAVSPAYYDHFYTKLMENYLGYNNVTGISAASLGYALNSDFDEDEPYNREDSKGFVAKALEYISGSKDDLDVMVEGGNAYTWQYVDHILGAALDSSRYIKASYSVPFVGVVLHGYMNFAGTPLNMEGDVNYAKLKAIENGASVYFTLSYQNTQILKEDRNLSKYYSIRYDIWFDDVVEIYNELNNATKDVQNKIIIDHQFLSGMRVPDVDELDRDTDEVLASIKDFLNNKAEYEALQKSQAIADARDKIASVEIAAESFVKDYINYYSGTVDGMAGAASQYMARIGSFSERYATYVEAKEAYELVLAEYEAADEAGKAVLAKAVANAETAQRQALGRVRTLIRNIGRQISMIENQYAILAELYEDAKSGKILINNTENCPPSILTEIEEQLAHTEELMSEMMGVDFNMTVDKGQIDTILRTHVTTLILSAYGDTNHSSVGIVGKAENLYKLLAAGEYGLLITELDLLKYLPENQSLSDDALIAKYGLKANKSSVDGLVLYVKELLGDGYEFDPVVSSLKNGIEENIHEYIVSVLYSSVAAQGGNKLVAALNFVSTRLDEEGRLVSNSANVKKVTGLIDDKINALLFDKTTGVFNTVTDGKYDLSKLVTEEQMNDLIAACVKIINDNTRSEANPIAADVAIEYADLSAVEADLRAYIESTFYKKVLDTLFVSPETPLHIRTVTAQTDSSIALLLDKTLAAYEGNVDADAFYASYMNQVKKDADLKTILDGMNRIVKGAYGDVRTELENIYLKALGASILKRSATNLENLKKDNDTIHLREEAGLLMDEKLATATLADLDALIAEVIALYETYPNYDQEEYKTNAAEYVYYCFLKRLQDVEFENYYYDAELAHVDVAVSNKVVEMNAALRPELSEGYNIYDVLDVVMNALADTENSVYDFTEPLAETITHVAEGKFSLEDDVLAYYVYALLNSFEGHTIPTSAPVLPICIGSNGKQDTKKYAKVMTVLEKKMTENDYISTMVNAARANITREALPNYSIPAIEGIDFDGIIADIYDALVKSKYLTANEIANAETELIPALEDYVAYEYYMNVLKRLGANVQPIFHVSEVYSATLAETTTELKELMIYFVTANTDMTREDVIALGSVSSAADDDEELDAETSRYLSDDGRIVSVTYGDKNADGSYSAYKTFILNYNNFSVSVEYDGVTYTIPAYGYVIVMH